MSQLGMFQRRAPSRPRRSAGPGPRKQQGRDPLAELVRDWPHGAVVAVVEPHPHAGARGRVRWPRRENGEVRHDFPRMVLVDFERPRAGVRNCYAKPDRLRMVELAPEALVAALEAA